MSTRRAVYSAILGGYESLTEQPVARESAVPFICFTDDPELTSETWDIQVVEPAFPFDPIRSARRLKILGHERLSSFEETLWIDNRIRLLEQPGVILDEWLAEADMAMPTHSARLDLLDEFRAVIEGGYDDPGRVNEQLSHYAQFDPQLLSRKPLWTAILARRRVERVDATMRHWFDDVLRYSRRDQLSVLAAIAATGIAVEQRELENNESSLHQWLSHRYTRRQTEPVHRVMTNPLAPAVFHVRDLEARLSEVVNELARLSPQLEAVTEQRFDLLVSLSARESALVERETALETREIELADHVETIENLRRQAAAYSDTVAELQREAAVQSDTIASLQREAAQRSARFAELRREVGTHVETIDGLQHEVADRDMQVVALHREVAAHAETIHRLQNEVDDLVSSSSWRVTAPFRAATRMARPASGRRAGRG